MIDTKKLVGQRIRAFRRAKRLTQEQLADAVGMDFRYISKLETGGGFPSIEALEAIAQTLQVELKDFFDFTQQGSLEAARSYMLAVLETEPESVVLELVQVVKNHLALRAKISSEKKGQEPHKKHS